ncbi:helix-turn-helix transcriptional regulator [Ideonella dechloratans]|uniref:helix-turn-helix transcriptional regulator n=1 Tax=Ideonella dechloratans TaxID=36863 RepID=UPI0035B1EB07
MTIKSLSLQSPASAAGEPSASHEFDALSNSAYVRRNYLLSRVIPVAPTTLHRWVREGRFPKPHRIGPKASAWLVGEVRAALAAMANNT